MRALSAGRHLAVFACVLTLHAAYTTDARGSSDDEAAARTLFMEGRKLAAAGEYAAACPKFEESLRLTAGIGTELNLADCWEHLGRTASAWARFMSVASAARAANQKDRADVAAARAAALEARLTHLVVRVANPSDDLEILRDGEPLRRPSWGTPLPVDPGEHRIDARAPGHTPWSTTVKVVDAQDQTVDIPPLEVAPAIAVPVPPTTPVAVPPPPVPMRVDNVNTPAAGHPDDGLKVRRTIGLALGAAGVASIGVGVYFGMHTLSKRKDADEICPASPPQTCPGAEVDRYNGLMDDAFRSRTIAFTTLGLGTAAIAGGALLYLTSHPAEPGIALGGTMLPGFGRATISGRW